MSRENGELPAYEKYDKCMGIPKKDGYNDRYFDSTIRVVDCVGGM